MHAAWPHLTRTGFFKPVHVKSPPAHAVCSLIVDRKKLVGQRVSGGAGAAGSTTVFVVTAITAGPEREPS